MDRPLIPPTVFCCALVASIVYTFGVMLIKRSTGWNAGPWRTTFLCNLVTAGAFIPLWTLGGQIPSWSLLWQPLLVGSLFVGGQVFTILALSRGDVSLATPLLGLKILMVALFASLLLESPLPPRIWTASALATIAVALLGGSDGAAERRRVGLTAACSTAAAACYALFDVLVQQCAPSWGLGRFMPLTMLCGACLSLLLLAGPDGRLRDIARPAWTPILLGSLLIGVQAIIFVSTIAVWGHVAQANVVYSSRGLWSVLLMWTIGHWFSGEEHRRSPRVMIRRLLGAVFLSIAIVLVVR